MTKITFSFFCQQKKRRRRRETNTHFNRGASCNLLHSISSFVFFLIETLNLWNVRSHDTNHPLLSLRTQSKGNSLISAGEESRGGENIKKLYESYFGIIISKICKTTIYFISA